MEIESKFISSGCNTVYNAATWHKTLPLIAYASSNHVNIYDVNNNKVHLTLNGHTKRVNHSQFLTLSKEITLLSSDSDGQLFIWKNGNDPFNHKDWRREAKAKTDECISQFSVYEISETAVYIVTVSTSTQVTLWFYDGKEVQKLDSLLFGTTFQETSVLQLIEDRYLMLFLGGIDRMVHVYSVDLKEESKKLEY